MTNLTRTLNRRYYDTAAVDYAERHPEIYAGEAARLRGMLQRARAQPAPVRVIADLGSGRGFAAALAAAEFPRALVLACDLSVAMLRSPSLAGCRCAAGAAEELPLRDGSIDLLLCHSVLHHVVDWQAVLREAQRVLCRGGRLLIGHEPNSGFFRFSWQRALWGAYRRRRPSLDTAAAADAAAAAGLPPDEFWAAVEYHSPAEHGHYDARRGLTAAAVAAAVPQLAMV